MTDKTSPAPNKRVRGPFVVLGLATVILSVFGFAFGMWWSQREPRGPILAAAALGNGDVALLRRGFEERGYVHLTVEHGDTQRWSEALFGVPEDPSITRFGDHVVLRAREARGHVEIHAFEIHTGKFGWRGGRATRENARENPGGLPAFATQSLLPIGDRLFVLHGGPRPEVVVLDGEGTELGRVELDGATGSAGSAADGAESGERRAAIFGEVLLIATGDGRLREVDGTAASPTVRDLGPIPHGWCVTNDTLYLGDPQGLAVRRANDQTPTVLGDGFPITVLACANRPSNTGETWLVTIAPSGEEALQRVGTRDGAPALLGGHALPAIGRDLRLVGDRLIATSEGRVRLFSLGQSAVTAEVEDARAIELVGSDAVALVGDRVRLGSHEAVVQGARGLLADDAHVIVWSERELALFDDTLTRLDAEE
ncbi:MAG: hypothetical protein MUE69_31600 [Myxococcota bacterium]|jgi:hypothetical protein|nr:hypothetical protein [Myxococcota bacterium]